jgi:HTH-type transcriptional regulator / antitoxin HipB
MIQNERQYKITQTKLKEFEQQLAAIDPTDPNLHPRQIIAWKNSFNLTISRFQQEIAEYEELKSGNVETLELVDFNDLPIALIKARIVLGMTQKELAEKIGTQEQQIQRYEADRYAAISFDRMMKIAEALGMSLKDSIEIAIAPQPDSLTNPNPI